MSNYSPMLWRDNPWAVERAGDRPYLKGHVVRHQDYVWLCNVRNAFLEEPGTGDAWLRIGTTEPVGTTIPFDVKAGPASGTGIPVEFSYDGPDPAGFELGAYQLGTEAKNSAVVAVVAGDQRTLVDRGTVAGKSMVYMVRAFNAYGSRGPWSDVVVFDVPIEILDTPTLGGRLLDNYQAGLVWAYLAMDPQDARSGYELSYVHSSVTETMQVDGADVQFATVQMVEGKTYEFRVRALRAADGARSPYSDPVTLTASDLAPRNLRKNGVGITSAVIYWDHSGAGGVTGFEARSTSGGVVVAVGADERSAVVRFPEGTKQEGDISPAEFVVAALFDDLEIISEPIMVGFLKPTKPMLRLGEVTDSSVAMSWTTAGTEGLVAFEVARQVGPESWKTIVSDIAPAVGEYTDTTLGSVPAGVTVKYWVRSRAVGDRYSAWSAATSAKLPYPDSSPYNVSAEAVESGSGFDVYVSWEFDHPCKYFVVSHKAASEGTWSKEEVYGDAKIFRKYLNVLSGHQFFVTAYYTENDPSGDSESVDAFLTPLNPPQNIRKVAHYAPADLIMLWDPVPYAERYRINVTSTKRPYYWVTGNTWRFPEAVSSAGYTVKVSAYIGKRGGGESQIGPGMMGKPFHGTPSGKAIGTGWDGRVFTFRIEGSYDPNLPVSRVLINRRLKSTGTWETAATLDPDPTGKIQQNFELPTSATWMIGVVYEDGTADWSVELVPSGE